MKCPSCDRNMESFWCDDGRQCGMLYECKCSRKYFERSDNRLIRIKGDNEKIVKPENEHKQILKEIIGCRIKKAWHEKIGRIDNYIKLALDNGKMLVFYAEKSEYSLKLESNKKNDKCK